MTLFFSFLSLCFFWKIAAPPLTTTTTSMGCKRTLRRYLKLLSPLQDGIVEVAPDGTEVEDLMASPSVSLGGHLLLAFLFSGTVIAYSIFAFVVFLTAPEQESFVQVPMATLPTQLVRVQAYCTNPPFCGDITVVSNYSSIPGCQSVRSFTTTILAADTVNMTVDYLLPLCVFQDFVFSVADAGMLRVPGLQVDFSSVNPGFDETQPAPFPVNLSRKALGVVSITSVEDQTLTTNDPDEAHVPLNKVVVQDAHQVKTLVVGRAVTRQDGVSVADRMLPQATQYEGKRPGNNWRSTAMIRYEQFATVKNIFRPGSVVETLANIGGASSLVSSILLLVAPLVAIFLPGDFSEEDGIPLKDVAELERRSDQGSKSPAPHPEPRQWVAADEELQQMSE